MDFQKRAFQRDSSFTDFNNADVRRNDDWTMMSSSYSFSTLYHQKSVLQLPRRERHQQRHALNFIVVQSKHHHHHRSLRKVQHQHHLKKTSKTSVRNAATTENNNDDETVMKDVQVTLVDCVASDGAKMTKETRRNAEGSIEEMDNCRFDALRSGSDRFVLVEIFKGKEAIEAHKTEPHYKTWNKNVESIMAEPRSKRSYAPVFPTNEDWNAVNTPVRVDENGQRIEVAEGSGTAVACHVTIKVNKKDASTFEKVSIENAISSKLEEDGGCLRFDIFKRINDDDDADSDEYLFVEVFRDAQAQTFHSQTAHSQNWKTKVEPMMAAERTWTQFDEIVFPIDDTMWADGDACEDACEMAW